MARFDQLQFAACIRSRTRVDLGDDTVETLMKDRACVDEVKLGNRLRRDLDCGQLRSQFF